MVPYRREGDNCIIMHVVAGMVPSLMVILYLEGILKVIQSSGFSDFFCLHSLTALTSVTCSHVVILKALVTCSNSQGESGGREWISVFKGKQESKYSISESLIHLPLKIVK